MAALSNPLFSQRHGPRRPVAAGASGACWRPLLRRRSLRLLLRLVAAAIRTAFAQESEEAAHRQWRRVADGLRERFRRLAELMDGAEHDVLAYMAFHRDHWTKISSTNPLERLNGEIKRRTDVVAIFPNDAALTRLAGAILLEQNDEWAVGRRSMSLETMAPLGHTEPVRLPAITA